VDDHADKEWSKWTPQGKIEMSLTYPAALARFELCKGYVDFSLAPAPVPEG